MIKGIGPEAFVSIYCGRNAIKNKETFGFVRLVKSPCKYIFLMFNLLMGLENLHLSYQVSFSFLNIQDR